MAGDAALVVRAVESVLVGVVGADLEMRCACNADALGTAPPAALVAAAGA